MTQKRKRYDKQFKIAAARAVLGGEMRAVDLARELGIKDSTLRRWAREYEEMGDNAFPGNGSPKVNKDYEIVKLRKRIEELERENELLKNLRFDLHKGRYGYRRINRELRRDGIVVSEKRVLAVMRKPGP